MTRLETVAKDLAEKLRMASPSQQRAASFVACKLGLQAAPINASIVSEALALLRKQDALPIELTAKLNELAAQIDEALRAYPQHSGLEAAKTDSQRRSRPV